MCEPKHPSQYVPMIMRTYIGGVDEACDGVRSQRRQHLHAAAAPNHTIPAVHVRAAGMHGASAEWTMERMATWARAPGAGLAGYAVLLVTSSHAHLPCRASFALSAARSTQAWSHRDGDAEDLSVQRRWVDGRCARGGGGRRMRPAHVHSHGGSVRPSEEEQRLLSMHACTAHQPPGHARRAAAIA